MASTANTGAITRTEFERMASRLTALESNAPGSGARMHQEGRIVSGRSEAVTQNEFRLFKWLATFVVAAVLGAFGVIYQQIADVRVEMRDLHNTVLRELYTQLDAQIGGLRKEMKAEIGGLRQDIGSLRERVVRVETLLVGEESRTES
ncbi:MAG: hypothetical protein F4Z28_11925 [Gammaproteobacteria bacterium]|nr:hypothetical protein [Gammaproteobacteria bacterium]